MKILKALERIATAAAFAEAGEWDTAIDIMQKEHSRKKILIAYEGEPTNARLVEYALGIAERVKCDMLFAYVATKKKTEQLTTEYVENINDSFNKMFEHEVDMLNIPKGSIGTQQIIVFDSFYEAVNSICKDVNKIEFAILGCNERHSNKLKISVPYFFFK